MTRQRGFAMLWAMFLVVAVGSLSFLVLERDRTMRRDGVTDAAALAVFHAAEGGLAHARHALRTDPAWRGATEHIGRCDVEIEVEAVDDGWRVRCAAEPGAGRVEAVLRRGDGLPRVARWGAE